MATVSRSEQKKGTRRALLEAALELSVKSGFSSLSLRAVCAHAGIAPTSFYRHFVNLDELGLALVDEVGMSLRQLVREARRSVETAGTGSVVRPSIETFMAFADAHSSLFRLLLGEGSGSTPAFRHAIRKEIARFTSDLVEDLERAAKLSGRPLADVELAAEAMVTVAFNLGASAIDLPREERKATAERIIREVRIIMRGAEAMAAGWEPGA
ncbi:MAG: HTH-type transcriptional repressor FabR [Candidatus Binatia bacterium]